MKQTGKDSNKNILMERDKQFTHAFHTFRNSISRHHVKTKEENQEKYNYIFVFVFYSLFFFSFLHI